MLAKCLTALVRVGRLTAYFGNCAVAVLAAVQLGADGASKFSSTDLWNV